MFANRQGLVKKAAYLTLILSIFVLLALIALSLHLRAKTESILAAINESTTANQPPADTNQPHEQTSANDKKPPRPTHSHKAFGERTDERERMITHHIQNPFFSKAITDPNVLAAMKTVPRHAFVLPGDLRRAYGDHPLPIGLGQTISQPYIVAYMTEALEPQSDSKVLEIGTGSGYQAAVCAEITQQVFTIEIIEALAKSAKSRLKELGYHNVSVKAGDGYYGWPEHAPFDAIIVTAAAGFVPPPLVKQLKPGGKMILPLGSPYGAQRLILITKDNKGNVRTQNLLPVRFVPMLGKVFEAQGR